MRLSITLLCVALFASNAFAWRTFLRGRGKGGNLGKPIVHERIALPAEQWIDQNLDHFNPTEGRIWQQRYFENLENQKNGGPAFLMIGGEGDANPEWMAEGQWIEYAKQFGASCFLLEHRYYGKSHPTQDLSTKNLQYLTSEQALADLAFFIHNMTEKHQMPENTRWIVFGGSYSGALAAWMRVKYPHLVHGAVSASGPLLAKLDFQEYFVVVEEALKQHSQACVDSIYAAIKQIHIMLRHVIGQQGLMKKFNLCDPIDPGHTKKTDISNFYETLAGNLAEVVQYNRDNRKSSKIGNFTIDTICDIFVNESIGTPVDRYAQVSNVLLSASGEKCFNYRYIKMIDELRNVTWTNEAAEGGRQWTYQTCTEFGFFQTSTARPELLSDTFPVDFYVQQCIDIFGPRYNEHLLNSSVERTNTLYGALNLEVTNVVYVHGSIDPWHILGITKSDNPEAPAIYINGTAHCANMYPASDNDLPELTQARAQVGDLIGKWLKN